MKKKNRNFSELSKRSIIYFPCLIIMTVVIGCSTGGVAEDHGSNGPGPTYNNPGDTIPPVVEVVSPAMNQVYTSGNTITVSGRATDGDGLYRGSVRITKDVNGDILKEQLYEIHFVTDYSYSVNTTAVVTAATDYTVTIWFEDHGLNKVTKTLKIKVNP